MSTVAIMEVETTAGGESSSAKLEKDNLQTEENVSGRGDLMAVLQDSLFQNNSSNIPPLEEAESLFEMGVDAVNSDKYEDGLNFLSRALEIRVAHYGELAPECGTTYLEYGRALFYKGMEECILLKYGDAEDSKSLEDESKEEEDDDDDDGESSNSSDSPPADTETASRAPAVSTLIKSSEGALVIDNSRDELVSSASASADESKDTSAMEEKKAEGSEAPAIEDASSNNEDSREELSEGHCDLETEEENSNLDLAWKMLDIARRIFEHDKKANDLKIADVSTMLGDVSLEREDLDSCLKDYTKALTILEGTVVPDSPHIASICYKMCLALDSQERVAEALNYGRRAAKVLECRLYRVMNEVKRIEAELPSKAYDSAPDTPENIASTAPEQVLQERDLFLIEMRIFGQLLIEFKDKIQELELIIEDGEEKESAKVSTSTLKDVIDSSPPIRGPERSKIVATHMGVAGRGIKRSTTPFPPPVRAKRLKRVSGMRTISLPVSKGSA